MNPRAQAFLTRNRGWILFLFALPVSFLVLRLRDLENWWRHRFRAAGSRHDRNVERIREQVSAAAARGRRMCTARKPWQTMSIRCATFKDGLAQIPVNLRNILALDEKRGIVRVEPLATMGELTRFLTPRGYALAVQPEMDDLTVGGLCLGVGIETSSHRWGFLFETVEAYEVVLGDGRLLRATRTQHADLYHALPWSHGTLGFLVAVELNVVRTSSHIRLRYLPCRTAAEFCAKLAMWSQAEDAPAYLEGLVYPGGGVVMAGELASPVTGEEKSRINAVNRWHKQWFHKHVERILAEGREVEEYLPIRHYFHRHTPSVFFQLEDLIPFAGRAWYRWLFGWLGAPRIALMKFSLTKALRRESLEKRVAQDLLIPLDDLAEGVRLAEARFGIFPLWVCPVRVFDHGEREGFLRNPARKLPGKDWQMFVDLGIYGIPRRVREGNSWNAIEAGRELEAWTRSKGGYHMLYADIFMGRDEFESMFEHRNYRAARERYGAERAFPEVYEKVVPEKWLLDLDPAAAEGPGAVAGQCIPQSSVRSTLE